MLLCTGCRDECRKLADKICDCRNVNEVDRENCISYYVDSQPVDVSDSEENTCSELRDKCSCSDLLEGRGDDCGLAHAYPALGDE